MANRGASHDARVHTIGDLKELGSNKLPKMYKDYFNEGAMDLITLSDNEAAYNRYKIRPRILVNVDNVDTRSSLFGIETALPLGFSPAAMHKLAHPDGELATSRAAAGFGISMGLSSYATESMENVASQGLGNPYFMQVCVLKDRSTTLDILRRAEENNDADRFAFDASLDWETTIPWLKANTKMQIWLKGVYTSEDVALAVEYGVDGVVVSNHGGRQLDGVPATLDSLRECVVAAGGRIPVAIDGGIRRGTDIFKALALGASHCLVGRIPIWGLAYNGQAGVELALKILTDEFRICMALAGCRTIKDITRQHITFLNSEGILAKL
ncbi:uncharacterized protein BCR38DRAFT_340822 [Pseudomassariella vexata]|uniref:FMN hydroxy acid dehydrogenase domain-containing protein n=1 Tax=Pseudomassariella vexata TaxID=1141098 RepID=A0A1Y2E2M6_9PEZI|nr:uncharacterized protein BCR38DRAFT_340822 [Pseudomassariella vexata]ORY65125.1 hypothetical protein BCR38DRAFT_340822 [Pseudomassariella vexata]